MKKALFLIILILGSSLGLNSQTKTYKPIEYPEDYKAQIDVVSDARACGKLFLIAQFERLPLF